MTIMRSGEFMKDKLVKRRNHVDWKKVIDHLEDSSVNSWFLHLKYKCKKMSDNRLAYLALLHYFDKKALDYYRITKDESVFIVGYFI